MSGRLCIHWLQCPAIRSFVIDRAILIPRKSLAIGVARVLGLTKASQSAVTIRLDGGNMLAALDQAPLSEVKLHQRKADRALFLESFLKLSKVNQANGGQIERESTNLKDVAHVVITYGLSDYLLHRLWAATS